MYKKTKPLFLFCETPLHVGSGSDLGVIDLPIQRERHTSFPKIESSSLKGALREAVEMNAVNKERDKKAALEKLVTINKVFGYDDADIDRFKKEDLEPYFKGSKNGKEEIQTSFAGAIGFTDARLLLFPVKSLKGIFAWVTCPKVLMKFESDMKLAFGDEGFNINGLSDLQFSNKAYVLSPSSKLLFSKNIILEEYTFPVEEFLNDKVQIEHNGDLQNIGEWLSTHLFVTDSSDYWRQKIQTDIVILPDDDFKDFVNLSTEVITRTKINNVTGTVEAGALFTEEYLPSESVLYALVLAHDEFTERDNPILAEEVLDFFKVQLPNVMQIGGNATIGKGMVRTGTFLFNHQI